MIRLDVPVHMGVHQQTIFLTGNGETHFRPFKVMPFAVDEDPVHGTEEVNVIGENRKTKIKYRYYDRMIYNNIGNAGPDGKYESFKPEVDYMINLYKEFPDEILTFFPKGCYIYPVFVDIETTSINPKSGEVLSVQVSYPDSDTIFLCQKDGLTEKEIILRFIELCRQSPSGKTPDICVNYNGIRFDIPYLYERAGTLEIRSQWNTIRRKPDKIFTQGWLVNKKEGEMAEVAYGLRCYDMYLLAKADLKLAKLPSRTQKAVAKFYGFNDVYDLPQEDKLHMRDVMEKRYDDFKKYALSDIDQLKYLFEIYAMRTAAEANLLKVPFITAYSMSSGQKSYIALYREARKAGYYGLAMNQERYPDYFAMGKYQGAIVGSWAHGYYDKIIYVDAKCLRKDTDILTDIGYKKLSDIRIGCKILSDKGFKKVAHIGTSLKHRMLSITTESGNNIVCSQEHKFPVYNKVSPYYTDNDFVSDKYAADLAVGDRLIECYNYPLSKDNCNVPDKQLYHAELLGIYDAEGYMNQSIRDRIRYDRSGYIQKNIRYSQLSFTINKDELLLKDRIIFLMTALIGAVPNVLENKRANALTIQYGSHYVYDKFKDILDHKYFILTDSILCKAYLRGVYSGDGSYNRKRKTISFTQSVVNISIYDFVSKCLTRCGIPHTKSKIETVKHKGKEYQVRRIEIPSRYVSKFMNDIGFIEDKKVDLIDIEPSFSTKRIQNGYRISRIRSIEEIYTEEGEELIDIMLEDQSHPYFYANHILTHNSMYPSIMESFNLSPDRYKILDIIHPDRWDDSVEGVIRAEGPPEAKIIYIPDSNFQAIFKFQVNLIENGYMRKVIQHFNKVRDDYKGLMKKFQKEKTEEGRNKTLQYDAMQMAAKVINNTYYGINGNRYYEIGDLPQAIFVTAMGRWCMIELIKFFGGTEDYRREDNSFGNTVLEADSVTGDTPVYIRSKTNGKIDIIPISDLHPDKTIRRISYKGDYEIMTRNGWKNIIYTKAHIVSKDIHRVKVSDGFVDVTSDHSIFDCHGNEVKPSSISVGDLIEVNPMLMPLPDPTSDREISIPLNPDLAWFYGLFLAEGSYSVWEGLQSGTRAKGKGWKRTNRLLSLSMNDHNILAKAKNICDTYLGLLTTGRNDHVVKIYDTMSSSSTYRLTGLTTIAAMEFFLSNFYSADGKGKKVPVDILNCSDINIIQSFMDGYMCGDGYETILNGRKVCSSDSHDRTLSTGIRYLLHRLGNKTTITVRSDKLNVVTVKKRFPYLSGVYRDINHGEVLRNEILYHNRDNIVYDISTEDGTFVSALGEIVLHNTDGLLLDNSSPLPTIDEINTHIRKCLTDTFSVPEDKLTFMMEFEGAGSIYVYKQKNYILRADEDEGKLTVKGSAFTGYDKAPVVKQAVDTMARCVMFQEIPYDQAVAKCRNFDRPLEDFRYTKTLKKDPDSYKSFESISNYIMNVEAKYGTKGALDEMKTKAREWITVRTDGKEKADLRKKAKGLVRDAINLEELFIVMDLIEEMVTGSSRKKASFFILDIVLMYKQRGVILKEDDIIEYYWTATKEGYSVAEDVKSISQLDLGRYMKEVNRVIERFEYANPVTSELTLW